MRTRPILLGATAAVLTALALGAGVAEAKSSAPAASSTGGAPTDMVAVSPPTSQRIGGTNIFDIVWYCLDTNGGGWPSVGECIYQRGQAD